MFGGSGAGRLRAETPDRGDDPLPCPGPDRHHGDHRCQADDDAEHCQGTAQLVQAECIKGGQDGVKIGHGVTGCWQPSLITRPSWNRTTRDAYRATSASWMTRMIVMSSRVLSS